MNREVWKSILGFSNYEISNHARVRNKNTGKLLNPIHITINQKDYLIVFLYSTNGEKRTRTISGLVATAFVYNSDPSNKHCVIHKDGNYQNNYPDNLEWVGKNKVVLQYSPEGKLLNEYVSIREASRNAYISYSAISRCCNNKLKTAGGYIWRFK